MSVQINNYNIKYNNIETPGIWQPNAASGLQK